MKFIKLYIDFADGNGLVEVQSPINGTFGVKQSEVSKLIFDKELDIEVSIVGDEYDKIITAKNSNSLLNYEAYSYNHLTKNYELFVAGEVFLNSDINFDKKVIKLKDFNINRLNELPRDFSDEVSTEIDNVNGNPELEPFFDVNLVDDSKNFTRTAVELDYFVNKFFNKTIVWNFDVDPAHSFNNNQLFITYNGFYRSPYRFGIVKMSLSDLLSDVRKIFNKEFFVNSSGNIEFKRFNEILATNTELFNLNDVAYSIDYFNFNTNELQGIGRLNLNLGEKTKENDTAFIDYNNKSTENKEIKTDFLGNCIEFIANDKEVSTRKYSLILAETSDIFYDTTTVGTVTILEYKLKLNRYLVPESDYDLTKRYDRWLHDFNILRNYYNNYNVYDNGYITFYDYISGTTTLQKYSKNTSLNPDVKRLDIINTFKVPYFDLNEKTGYKFRNKYITTPNGKGYIIEAKADVNNGVIDLTLEYYE